jgi:DNA helicase HerA-like ATPase
MEKYTDLSQGQKEKNFADDIIFKTYLSKLPDMEVVDIPNSKSDTRLFKITKMVYETEENATDKFVSVITAMSYADCSICLIVDGNGDKTDFYLGINSNDKKRVPKSIMQTFQSAIKGQFPGTITEDISIIEKGKDKSEKDELLEKINSGSVVSLYSGIPTLKDKKNKYTNKNFIQGIEKFANAMKGKTYTAVIIATNAVSEISEQRAAYESLYSKIATYATQQISYSSSVSSAISVTETNGTNENTATGDSINKTDCTNSSSSFTQNQGENHGNIWAKLSAIPVIGFIPGLFGKQKNSGTAEGVSHGESHSMGYGQTITISQGTSHQVANGKTETNGSSKNFSIKIQDKHIQELLKRIDKQLERISMFESNGLWDSCAYFVAYKQDKDVSETAATIFRSIMQGDDSGIEKSSVNTWYNANVNKILNSISSLQHPDFEYDSSTYIKPTSLISSSELAIMMGLPRKSVPGFPVIEHAALGKEVVKTSSDYENTNELTIGKIFDQGEEQVNSVSLSVESLTGHTFVTGATGSGKSETIYSIINGLKGKGKHFLVIEPAKGEYKKVFGNANVFGTNPKISKLLHINPFKFPKDVHVLEHIDRIIEIFNACWPMYAAMPAILKDSILAAYKHIGWDLFNSDNNYSPDLYPTFADVLAELKNILNNSEFHDDAKGNYKGALETRIKSLTNGIVGEIFSYNENGDEVLFDQDTIIDISRIGSQETKALIMGILIMRLNEYRMSKGEQPNSSLKHVTVLEEAHNILKNSTTNQNIEGGNVAAKAVEMISNSIAEMRTYGEGFIIADQSPNAVDISAIRNTNTKIIMRLPETEDRKTAGKASAMKDNQIDEIAKLPTGVAVVYQNNWEEPVLCKITKSDFERKESKVGSELQMHDNKTFSAELLKFFLQGRIDDKNKFDLDLIKREIVKEKLPAAIKVAFFDAALEYEKCGSISLWGDNNFVLLSDFVTKLFDFNNYRLDFHDIQGLENTIIKVIQKSNSKIPENLHIVICQCILRRLSLENNEWEKIYDEWMESKKKKS